MSEDDYLSTVAIADLGYLLERNKKLEGALREHIEDIRNHLRKSEEKYGAPPLAIEIHEYMSRTIKTITEALKED